MRGLDGIRFVTGSLMEAADLGQFDYIDCCGVLHHLPDPAAGFRALLAALAPGGGMGFMVYAPYGRSGVYPLQEAFGALLAGQPPEARLKAARKLVAGLPEGHPFRCNPNLGDHKDSDAGFYDLLLHSQDRAFDVAALIGMLEETGWALSGFAMPALYDLGRITEVPGHLGPVERMALAEKLTGTIKTHVGYAVRATEARGPARGGKPGLVPHLKGVRAADLARAVAQGKRPVLRANGSRRGPTCRARQQSSLPPWTGGGPSRRSGGRPARMPSRSARSGGRWSAASGRMACCFIRTSCGAAAQKLGTGACDDPCREILEPDAAGDGIGLRRAGAGAGAGGRGARHHQPGIGQPDFPTPPHIVEAGVKALRDGHHGYTPANGLPALREAVAADLHARHGTRSTPVAWWWCRAASPPCSLPG